MRSGPHLFSLEWVLLDIAPLLVILALLWLVLSWMMPEPPCACVLSSLGGS